METSLPILERGAAKAVPDPRYERITNLAADFVATTADGRTECRLEIPRREVPPLLEHRERLRNDTRGRSSPTAMNRRGHLAACGEQVNVNAAGGPHADGACRAAGDDGVPLCFTADAVVGLSNASSVHLATRY